MTSENDDPTQQRILDAAREEFINHGFRRTSVGDIAAKAKVDRSTLHRRFGNKEALIRAVTVRDVMTFFTEFLGASAHFDSAEDAVVEAFVAGVRALRTHALFAAIMKFEPETFSDLLVEDNSDYLATLRALLAAQLIGQAMDPDAAERAVQVILRITVTLMIAPTEILPIDTDDRARAFARIYFVPILAAARNHYN